MVRAVADELIDEIAVSGVNLDLEERTGASGSYALRVCRSKIVRTCSATRMGASQRTTLRLNLRTLSLARSASATKTPANLAQAPGYGVERVREMGSNR
jgi:hypothetical protein